MKYFAECHRHLHVFQDKGMESGDRKMQQVDGVLEVENRQYSLKHWSLGIDDFHTELCIFLWLGMDLIRTSSHNLLL